MIANMEQWARMWCEIRQHGNISRAAKALGVSQSALSQRIQHEERKMGKLLLDRRRRPLALTSDGKRVAELAAWLVEKQEAERNA